MSGFEGKAAFITGAGSGIGRATSLALASRGAFVWVTDFDEAGADGTIDLVRKAGGKASAIKLDVRYEAEWEAAFAQVDAHGVPLGVLVNCAGKNIITDTFTMPLEDFRFLLSVNVESAFLGMKLGIPRIAKSGGGAVVNISSIMGLQGQPRMAGYCGAKGAVRMMTKAIALECAELRNNVRVNSLHPGIVDTPAWHKHSSDEAGLLAGAAGTGAAPKLDAHEVAKTMVPIGVAASVEEIAETVCFLASNAARHITGAEIVIDGGMTAD